MNWLLKLIPYSGIPSQTWYRMKGLGSSSTSYARLCWHTKRGITPSRGWEEGLRGGKKWGRGNWGWDIKGKKNLNKKVPKFFLIILSFCSKIHPLSLDEKLFWFYLFSGYFVSSFMKEVLLHLMVTDLRFHHFRNAI